MRDDGFPYLPYQRSYFSWPAFLRRVSMKYPPLGLSWTADGTLVTVRALVRERETGEPIPLFTPTHLALPAMADLAAAAELRDTMAATLLHELNEQFLLDGERVFDPHKKKEK